MVTRLTPREVASMVREYVEAGEPLSVIRLGDGESRLMGWPEFTPAKVLHQSLYYWFGRADFADEDLTRMAKELRHAIRQADVIGIPQANQIRMSDGWANVMRYIEHYDLTGDDAQFCDASLHRNLQEQGLYENIMLGLGCEVYAITCRDVGDALSWRFDVPIIHVPIPEEGNTGRRPTSHWPKRYNELRQYLAHPMKGKLVLIGAGVLGKIYAGWIKKSGGVALDVGSVFDGWAGVTSRSYISQQPKVYAL